MRALRKKPGCGFEEIDIPNTMEALQAEVGGSVESIMFDGNNAILCNEEGLLEGLPLNIIINGCRFVGTILIVGTDGEEFTDYNGGKA